jgi:mRNA-degrading endonuclease RelE of RelBE toxin-antitoxin system
MSFRIQMREQVWQFLEKLGPDSRRRLKLAIKGLGAERGDRLALRERLSGYHRLKAGRYRIVYRHLSGRVIECVFAEERSVVYTIFEREMMAHLRHEQAGGGFDANEDPSAYEVGKTGDRGRRPVRGAGRIVSAKASSPARSSAMSRASRFHRKAANKA